MMTKNLLSTFGVDTCAQESLDAVSTPTEFEPFSRLGVITFHFPRRSGPAAYARRGMPLAFADRLTTAGQ